MIRGVDRCGCERDPGAPTLHDRPSLLRSLYHATSVASIAGALAWFSRHGVETRDVVLLGAATALLTAGLRMRVHDVRRSAGGASQSMHAATATFLLLLVGPALTVVGTLIASIAYDLMRRRSAARLVGNLPTRLVPVVAGGLAWRLLDGNGPGTARIPQDYLPLAATVVAFALVNELCFIWDSVAAPALGRRPRWRDELDRLPGNLATTLMECGVGACAATLCLLNPWTAPLVIPLAASMHVALERGNRIQRVTVRALDTFARIVDERDRYTFEHSDRVCDFALAIGRRMGLGERQLEALYWTSRLHDLGKVAVDNAVLNKPGRLDPDEFDVMRRHPEVSSRILASFSFDDYDADVVACHHERWDGRGYLGRDRDDVPLEAYIIAVADAFDAMTSDRPYRDAMPEHVALEEIALGLGTQFHPEVGRAFLDVMGYNTDQLVTGTDDGRTIPGHDGHQARSRRPRLDVGDDHLRDAA